MLFAEINSTVPSYAYEFISAKSASISRSLTACRHFVYTLRAVFEAIGAKVDYVAEEQKVIATKGDITVEFVINSNVMKINGEEKELDVPAMIKDDRTLVPVRACAEAFNLKVDWNGNTNTVRIKKSVSLESETNIAKYTYDENGNKVYYENSNGYWEKYAYDENGNKVYYEDSDGDWIKYIVIEM